MAVDVGLAPPGGGSARGLRPRRRWLITELEGLSWEGRMRVAGHLSLRHKEKEEQEEKR